MKKSIILSLFTLLALILTTAVFAYDGITMYGAEISSSDRYNSNGERLHSVRDILRQDRANVHKFGSRDKYDQSDNFFSSKSNREIFDTANISISPSLARKITSNEPVLITVFVLTRHRIEVVEGLPNPNVD